MMESLRNFLTGPRLLIVVLVCALPFVFLGTSSLGSVFNGSFGTINGEDVSEIDIQLASNSATQRFKSIYGEDFDFDMLDDDFKAESIKQELIVQKVLQAGARSMGFINKSSQEDVMKSIVQSSIFQVDGVFSEDVYAAQVNSNGYTKESYIEVMTNLAAAELYRSSFTSLDFVTKNELIELTNLLEKSSDIKFIKINYEDLKEQIVNTETELSNYYSDNEIKFYSEEEKSFEYIILDQSEYKDNIQIPETYLSEAYDNYVIRFDNSAQIRISHIMVEKNNYDSRDSAYESITKINDLLLNGDDFATIANKFSEDIVTKEIGGDLDYYEKDVFPEEFEEALVNLNLDDISQIVELDESFHILKVTEKNIQEPLSEKEIRKELIDELIETESFALMQDDYSKTENMILDNNTLNEISEDLSQVVNKSDLYNSSNYNFEFNNPEIKDYLFSSNSPINKPYAIDLGDKIIILSINQINESSLQPFESVNDSVSEFLSESKALNKINLLSDEIRAISSDEERNEFISAYDYVIEDSFIGVKRYSSLLPREVLNIIFNSKSGIQVSADSQNGDKYIIDIEKFNMPTEDEIINVVEDYTSFGKDVLTTKMSQIINDEVFLNARVNLNNLIF